MTTPAQTRLIEAIRRTLDGDPMVRAAWLSGSFGRGTQDDFSDVDVLVLVDDPWQETADRYARDVSAMAEAALVNPLFGGAVLNVVTAGWDRFDLSFIGADRLGRYDAGALQPLFNKTGQAPPIRPPPPPYQPSPERIGGLIREFLRVLGLASVVVGREEYVVAVSGTEMLRRAVIELMIEANAIAPEDRGGALHLRRLLSGEQLEALAAFPPLRADRESALAGVTAAASLFLPLARRLAAAVGAQWPETLETATRRRLRADFGIEF